VKPEGQAAAGDYLRTPWGQELIVVSVMGAGDLIEAIVERQIALRTPNFIRDSITARCALFGATSGQERQALRAAKARLNRPVRLLKERV
jgi:hypothetical protein